jgi:hypothetical protein
MSISPWEQAAGAGAVNSGGKARKVVRVAPDSPRPELMSIGHSNKSQTFVPEVRPGLEFVYCDCPGFLVGQCRLTPR